MNKTVSAYLDLLRMSAAVAVFLGHSHGYIIPSMPLWMASHAGEAVSAFFVLSGFVISFVLTEKEKTYKTYIYARFVRIFSVVLVSLTATYVVDLIGRNYNALSYDTIPFYNDNYYYSAIRALTFTNEFWSSHSVFGSNEAYWSLGFEIPYYIAAGLFVFMRGVRGIVATMVFLLLAGPKITLYFPLWLVGSATYKICSSKILKLSTNTGLIFLAASFFLYMGIKLLFSNYKLPMFENADLHHSLQSLIYYFAISLSVALSIFAISRLDRSVNIPFTSVTPYLQWTSNGSFTLYLVHQPLLTALRAVYPNIVLFPTLGCFGAIAVVVVCYALAEVGERRKRWYGKMVMKLMKIIRRRDAISPAR